MTTTAWSSPLPAGVRHTASFRSPSYPSHGGDDYAPKVSGTQGVVVHAIGGGTVVAVGDGNVLRGHTGKGVLIDHGGGVMSYYGHLASYSVKVGTRVTAGQAIGVMGWTGNVIPKSKYGTHLHLGVLVNGALVNADAFMRARGVVIGRDDPLKKGSTPNPVPGSGSLPAVKTIQTKLRDLGYYSGAIDNVAGPMTRDAVRAYQRAQRYFPGQVADGVWGPLTEAHYRWTRTLQTTLNRWKSSVGSLRVDGDLGALTIRRVRDVQSRNRTGAYARAGGRTVDGVPGPITCRMLGIPAHPTA